LILTKDKNSTSKAVSGPPKMVESELLQNIFGGH
jgi:hypothetical protein